MRSLLPDIEHQTRTPLFQATLRFCRKTGYLSTERNLTRFLPCFFFFHLSIRFYVLRHSNTIRHASISITRRGIYFIRASKKSFPHITFQGDDAELFFDDPGIIRCLRYNGCVPIRIYEFYNLSFIVSRNRHIHAALCCTPTDEVLLTICSGSVGKANSLHTESTGLFTKDSVKIDNKTIYVFFYQNCCAKHERIKSISFRSENLSLTRVKANALG